MHPPVLYFVMTISSIPANSRAAVPQFSTYSGAINGYPIACEVTLGDMRIIVIIVGTLFPTN